MMQSEGLIQDHTLSSRALKRSMRARVYLPPRYEDFTLRYPVIYLLHPWGADEGFWTDTLDFHHLADRLILPGILPPFIAVMPQGDKSFFVDAAHPGGDFSSIVRLDPEYYQGALEGAGRYGEHLLEDVMPFVEKNFRARSDRAGRVIAGVGMGAAGAAVLAFSHLGRFGAVGIHSPTLFDDWHTGPPWIFGLGDREASNRRDPIRLAGALRRDSGLQIYLDCGVEDEMSEPVANLHWALTDCGSPHTYVSQPGDHSPAYWSAHLAEYLGFYAGGW
jgi:enterochelin esterase-like enzyme